MIRLRVISDLHVDVAQVTPPRLVSGVDVVIVAGDTMQGVEAGFAYLRTNLGSDVAVVVVAGNHEFYGSTVEAQLAIARDVAPNYGITFLENTVATIMGVRFCGATLWTDYALYGDPRAAMILASVFVNDQRRVGDFPPLVARERHQRSRAFLGCTPCDVVVTHHLPSLRSVHPTYDGDPLNPAFASDLDDLVVRLAPKLWVHGHTHRSCDYRIGPTRVVYNPHGYGGENPDYDPNLVVEVETSA